MVSLINATLQLRIDATKEDFQKENVWKRIQIPKERDKIFFGTCPYISTELLEPFLFFRKSAGSVEVYLYWLLSKNPPLEKRILESVQYIYRG